MIRLVTFGTYDFEKSVARLRESAFKYGADDVSVYWPDEFSGDSFEHFLTPLVPNSRGYGWWIWKPAVILRAISTLKEGDTLIYSDAGQEIVGDLESMPRFMDQDIMMFTNGFQHSHWCKREVAYAINEAESDRDKILEPDYYTYKQVQASFILFKVNDKVKDFIKEWFAWCIMPGMCDNTPRGIQFQEFQEHRHDQAILTCLQIKYGYQLNWFPSSTNLHQGPDVNTKYGIKLLHHRMRDCEYA